MKTLVAMSMNKTLAGCSALFLTLGFLMAGPVAAAPDVMARVVARGHVICGVDHTPGFSGFDESGRPRGFEVDFCRAVAAAVLGNADRIRTERVNTAAKFKALVDGEIDIAFGMGTWTYTRDTALGVRFVAPTFIDGQGFLAWVDSPYKGATTLKGARVCVQQGTTTAANLRDYDRRLGLGLRIVESSSSDDRTSRFVRRECDLMTGDRSELAAQRIDKALDPTRWRLLDTTISREPLGPYVVGDDNRWFALVRWAVLVPQIAELRGMSSRELAKVAAGDDGELRRLAGLEKGFGKPLGLDDGWARRIIDQLGHYGEIFDRHLGANSPFRLERGPNKPVSADGWVFLPPLR
jgi:general L-amino acid transport system substrate-binding protein